MALNPIDGTNNGEVLQGTALDDLIRGFGGDDTLQGNGGNDTLEGGDGSDVLTGGAGIDTLTGGDGPDTFRDTAAGLNGDTITDLLPGDRIQISDLTKATANFSISGSSLTFGGTNSVQISNLGPGRLVVRDINTGGVEVRLEAAADNDFNGDGRSDVLLVHDNGTVIDWLGNSDGTFTSNHVATTLPLPTGWRVSNTGDFNGDGRVDILLRNDNGSLTEWVGKQNGGFAWNSAATYGLDANWSVAGAGDFNGDGRADVLLRYTNGTTIDWLGQADGTFISNHANTTYALPTAWHVAGTSDFNGDGKDDLLLRNDDGTITEWLGQANGSFTWNSAATYGLSNSWHVVGVGDFDGDGRADVALRYDNGTVIDWLGQADGTFFSNHANATYALDPSWQVGAVGDFNGDARDDLLLRNANGTITEWLGATNGSFSWNSSAIYGLDNVWHVKPTPDIF
jgi:hypothetical protein